MCNRRGVALLVLMALVGAANGACFAVGNPADSAISPVENGRLGDAFQKAVGGVGLSAAVSPAWSFFAVDPRVESYCENELWPIPGGRCYSPYHGALVADLPPREVTSGE